MLRLTLALSGRRGNRPAVVSASHRSLRHERPNAENYPEAQCALKPQIT